MSVAVLLRFLKLRIPVKQPYLSTRGLPQYTRTEKFEQLRKARVTGIKYEDLLKKMKLKETKRFSVLDHEVQLLKNDCEDMDYLLLRRRQPLVLSYKLDLLLQRVQYLSNTGLTSTDKLSLVTKKPPVFIICRNESFEFSKMLYLRGIVKEERNIQYVFYPVFPRLIMNKSMLQKKIDTISQEIGASNEKVIHMVLNLPCYSLNTSLWDNHSETFAWMHKWQLPFDLDKHTMQLHPPVYSNNGNIKSWHFTNNPAVEDISDLAFQKLTNILDLEYPICYGRGTPEDLRQFLFTTYESELKLNPRWIYKKKKFIYTH